MVCSKQLAVNRYLQSLDLHYNSRIAALGSVIFMGTEHHRIKVEVRQTYSMEVYEAVYHKSELHNHCTKHAKLEGKCN